MQFLSELKGYQVLLTQQNQLVQHIFYSFIAQKQRQMVIPFIKKIAKMRLGLIIFRRTVVQLLYRYKSIFCSFDNLIRDMFYGNNFNDYGNNDDVVVLRQNWVLTIVL